MREATLELVIVTPEEGLYALKSLVNDFLQQGITASFDFSEGPPRFLVREGDEVLLERDADLKHVKETVQLLKEPRVFLITDGEGEIPEYWAIFNLFAVEHVPVKVLRISGKGDDADSRKAEAILKLAEEKYGTSRPQGFPQLVILTHEGGVWASDTLAEESKNEALEVAKKTLESFERGCCFSCEAEN